jgi:uncharacterized membrane protein HdeD (DUF308 family)
MLTIIADSWWMLLIRGLAAIAFGVLTFLWPQITLLVLIVLFAVHCIVDGVMAVALGLHLRKKTDSSPWPFIVLMGILSVAAGILALAWPGLTAVLLLFIIAGWAIARGVLEVVAAIHFRKVIDNEWFLGLAGGLSVLFGVCLIAWPGAGLLSLMWLVGSFSMAIGILMCLLAFRLKGLGRKFTAALQPPPVG